MIRGVKALFNNPYQLWLSLVLLLAAGLSSLNTLPQLEDPRLLNRFPSIQTPFPGATPEQVEALVTEPIESAISEVAQVGKIESVSGTGLSVVSVELDDSVTADNQAEILAQIREKLDSVELPASAGRADLSIDDGGGAYTLMVAINSAPDSLYDAIALGRLADDLGDALRQLNGTETVELIGEIHERISIVVDPTRLAQSGLKIADLSRLIAAADINGASGVLRQQDANLTLNMAGGFETLDRIRQLPLRVDGARNLTVEDIAQVRRGWQTPVESQTYYNDRPGVIVAVRVGPQVQVDAWTESAKKVVDRIAQRFPDSFEVQSIFEQRGYISDRLSELAGNLIAGAGIVFVVVLFFMGWRAALIVGSALPLTFAGVLFGLSLIGVQIHQMSVFGMIIALGLLIDNAIVMVDEARVRMLDGESPQKAVTGAVGYLSGPLFASTLTTVLGFAPILLLSGAIGDFIKAIAISVTLALIVSYVISMTLIPALAGRYPGRLDRTGFLATGLQAPAISKMFRHFLTFTTRWTPVGIVLSLVPAVAGFALVGTLGMQFFPAADRDHFEVKIAFPPSQSIQETQAAYDRIYDLIQADVNPIAQSWVLGQSHPAVYYNQIPEQRRNDAYLHGVLTFESASQSRQSIPKLQALLDEALPTARVVALPFAQGPPVAYPLAFRLFGPDLTELAELGMQVRQIVQNHPQVLHSTATISQDALRLGFTPDEARLRQANLSLSDLSAELAGATEGLDAGTLMEGVNEMEVRVRYDRASRDQLADLNAIQIQVAGDSIALSDLGRWELQPEPAAVTRFNGERVNTVGAWLLPDALAIDVTNAVVDQLNALELPAGYRLEVGGESEEQADSVGALAAYLPVILVAIVATLILSFQSIRIAGLIFFVGAASIGTGLFALVLSGYPLGFNPILGTAGLMGVAINGSIVVLAAIQASPQARAGDPQALANAAMSCSRHILSTTLTTIGGFLPLILGGGLFWPPLAVVIAGGVGFSVLLGLVLTPALYRVVMWYRPKIAPDHEESLKLAP